MQLEEIVFFLLFFILRRAHTCTCQHVLHDLGFAHVEFLLHGGVADIVYLLGVVLCSFPFLDVGRQTHQGLELGGRVVDDVAQAACHLQQMSMAIALCIVGVPGQVDVHYFLHGYTMVDLV